MKRANVTADLARALCASLLLFAAANAQQKKKFTDAVERSTAAGRIVEMTSLVPGHELPKELLERAQAVGVFHKVEEESVLFMQTTQGSGVISARGDGGAWTPPAFYKFVGGGYTRHVAKDDTYYVVFLFMTKDAVAAFEKGGVTLKGDKKALAGPVGELTDERRKEIEGAHILAYAHSGDGWRGAAFGKSFWKSFLLDPDNNINKPLYGMKGREVLAGKKVETSTLPEGVLAFQAALQKYHGAR